MSIYPKHNTLQPPPPKKKNKKYKQKQTKPQKNKPLQIKNKTIWTPQTNKTKQNKKKIKQKTQVYIAVKNSVEKKMIPIVIWFGGLHRPMSIIIFFLDSNNFYFLAFKWHCLQTMK